MGRPKKQEKDCKIKFGISLDRELFDRMVKDKLCHYTNLQPLWAEEI